ncbi:MAG TPA: hypothetical protein VH088_21760 [Terriglobales bacterium]|jgi:hypothetical protein|nr:hypothetical protein [Terriglobales bacterium]
MRAKVVQIALVIGCLVVFTRAGLATTAPGTLGVTATVDSSMNLVFSTDASGITLGGSGTSAATIAFGNVQAFGGTVPTGVTRTVNALTNWRLATPFDVLVEIANQTSSNYTLTAQLQTSDSTNTWQLGSTTITSASAATLTSTGTYGTTVYILNLTIPFSEAAGAISNTLNFVATAN